MENKNLSFKEALKILNIEQYEKRIFNSNSHGELFHLQQYIVLAKTLGKTNWFSDWFKIIVEEAGKNWKRPESVFQHIDRIFLEHFSNK